MPLQKKVGTYLAEGIPGMPGDTNICDYHPNTLKAEVPITVGTAVWRGTDPQNQAKYGGTGSPIGIVERNLVYADCLLDVEGTPVIPEGDNLTIMRTGCMWVISKTAATVGQVIIPSTTDGTFSTGAAGDDGDFGWTVETAAEAGGIVLVKKNS